MGVRSACWRCPACGALYLRIYKRTGRPILDLSPLRYPTYRASLLGGTLVRLGIGASPFLMPLLLQVALGWSSAEGQRRDPGHRRRRAGRPSLRGRRPQAVRLSHVADGVRHPDGAVHGRAGLLRPRHVDGHDDGGADPRRVLPLEPVHRRQHHRLCRRAGNLHGRRLDLVGRDPAGRPGPGGQLRRQ
ncbi:hypothetical protein ACRAWD_10855 [Caulobacter segnis]